MERPKKTQDLAPSVYLSYRYVALLSLTDIIIFKPASEINIQMIVKYKLQPDQSIYVQFLDNDNILYFCMILH